jgi:hypothetical protein
MCKAASFIVVKGEPPKWSRKSDSHEVIRDEHKLPHNTDTLTANVQVEITPPNETDYETPLSKWVFRVDQDRLPKWWDAKEAEAAVRKELKEWAKAKLVRAGEKRDVNDGDFVHAVCGGTVNEVRGGTVNEVRGGTVNAVCGGTVNEVWGGTVNKVWGGTVNEVRGGTVNAVCGGTVNEVWGGTVNEVWGGTVLFRIGFKVKFSGLFSVIINRIGNVAKCHVGTDVERVVTDKD